MLTSALACAFVAVQDIGPSLAHARGAHAKHNWGHSSHHTQVRYAGRWHGSLTGGGTTSEKVGPRAGAGRSFGGSGIASVYSGSQTASGERMNADAMTAAIGAEQAAKAEPATFFRGVESDLAEICVR